MKKLTVQEMIDVSNKALETNEEYRDEYDYYVWDALNDI